MKKQLVNFEHFNIIKEAEEKLDAYLDNIAESLLIEAKKPKSWDSMFAMNAIADYEAGKFDPDNDASLAKWEKDYNGGVAPKPGFETYDIIAYALTTGKKPDGTPIKESVINEAEPAKAKTRLGAALGSPVKFIKIKNNAKKYQQTLVQKALNNLDYEKKKQAAGGEVDKDKMEVLKAANTAKNQALTDKGTAIADRMKDLATSPGLEKVKTLAMSKAKVAAAETALKGADAEESKQLKIRIKELNAKAAEAEKAIKDYEKDEPQQQEAPQPQEAPQQQEAPKVKEDPNKEDNTEKIAALDSKIDGLKQDKKTKEDQLNSKNHPDVLAVEVAIKSAELEKAKLSDNTDSIKSAEAALKTAKADQKEAVDAEAETEDTPQNNSYEYVSESVSDKFRRLMTEQILNEGVYTPIRLTNMLIDDIIAGKRDGIHPPDANELKELALKRIGQKRLQKQDIDAVISSWDSSISYAKKTKRLK